MGTVSNELTERAQAIFTDLGYRIERDGPTLTAERGWKTVEVTPTDGKLDPPDRSAPFHCFVADQETVDSLERSIRRSEPDYEWAIIVVDGEDYAVERAPPTEAP